MAPLVSILLPLAVDLLRSYIKNSDSSRDDKVLAIVQDGCSYLSRKENNDLGIMTADAVSSHKMIGELE